MLRFRLWGTLRILVFVSILIALGSQPVSEYPAPYLEKLWILKLLTKPWPKASFAVPPECAWGKDWLSYENWCVNKSDEKYEEFERALLKQRPPK